MRRLHFNSGIQTKGSSACEASSKNKVLNYSGAFNSLYLVREGVLNETKADKIIIGNTIANILPYTNHTIQLQKNDMVYLFTDGYADQFGGPDGKKFKHKQFNELLVKNHDKPLNDQKEILINAFNEWKGTLEQVDDVCVIGIRI